MPSRKILLNLESRAVAFSGKGPFLLVTFLWALAKKSNSLAQRVKAVYFSQKDGQAFVLRSQE
jgi:hypothetical protein